MRKASLRTLLILAVSLVAFDTLCSAATLTWGPYARFRHEYWKNIFDMNDDTRDDRSFYRFKFALWGKAELNKNVSVFAKLANESKAFVTFDGGNAAYDPSEVVVDNLYVDVKNAFGAPVDLRLGRQDFLGLYGEGFLLAEGTPMDGSRTYYFNAAKATWKMNASNSLDALYIGNKKYDDLLPIINEIKGKQLLNYTDERAFSLYHKTDISKQFHNENYYIWKHEDEGGPRLTARETTLNTFGTYMKYSLARYTLRGQLAYQTGTYGSEDRRGLGGFLYTDVAFAKAPMSPLVTVGYSYLSGDDPATAKNEAWDPLFARAPWISELYSLSYNSESGMDYWTNLQFLQVSAAAKPFDKAKLTLYYFLLYANETATGAIFGTGKERGQMPQVRFDYAFTKNITSYVLAEHFMPGNFYASGSDSATFVRTEVQLKF